MMQYAQMKESGPHATAVMVSMHTTKESWVMYRESEREYSFQSWPKRSVRLAMSRKLYAK